MGLLAALLAAAAVQAAPIGPVPPTADQVAAARAEGEALLQRAHAEALFVNETGAPGMPPTTLIRLRHKASGFLCMFDPGKAVNRVDVYRSLTPGSDVSCTTQTITDARTLYIFRAPDKSVADLLKTAEFEVHAADPTLAPYTPTGSDRPLVAPPGMTIPDHLAASEASDRKGVRIVVGRAGDWAVEYRFEGPRYIANASNVVDPFWRLVFLEKQLHDRQTAAGQVAPAPPASAPSPQDVKAEADALIARGQGAGLFENVTSVKTVEVRHIPSGFTCVFDPGQAENAIQVFANPVRGNDIGCTTREAEAVVSYYVTKPPGLMTLEQALAVNVQAIHTAHPDAVPAAGTGLQVQVGSKPGAPPHVPYATARFTYSDHGEAAYSRVSVALVNGWIVEQRVTAPLDKRMIADLVGDLGILSAADKMARERVALRNTRVIAG